MAEYLYLSHFITVRTPVYGGQARISLSRDRDMSKGDTANTMFLSFGNHTGTHIDFPRHFSPTEKTSDDYPADFFVFTNPFLVTKEVVPEELLRLEEEIPSIPEHTDLLLIRTGFEQYRDMDLYWQSNPGLDAVMAEILKTRCPGLRAVGVDFISISSFRHREQGRVAHRKFLLEQGILLIEDMKLSGLLKAPTEVIVAPLLVEKADGIPATVIARI